MWREKREDRRAWKTQVGGLPQHVRCPVCELLDLEQSGRERVSGNGV
jgi:hypothetical protein